MGRFANPYGEDDRLPEGMICIGYDADTGCKSYVDTKEGGVYTGAPYAEYGILTLRKGPTTAREDNLRYGRKVYDESDPPVQKRRPGARASTTPIPYTISTVDCERIIPRRPQTKEKEVDPKYLDGSDGAWAISQVVNLNRSKTRRANTAGTWPPADQDLSEDEETDVRDSGISDDEEGTKQATTPQLGEYIFDQDTLMLVPSEGAFSESPTDSIRIPLLVANLRTSRRHTVGGVGELVRARTRMGSAEKRKKPTFFHRLLRVN
jgi:hypothetical protein